MLRMTNSIAINSNLGKSIGNGTTNRYYTTLDGVADYYTIPTVSLTGDFVIECDFTRNSNGIQILIGGDANNYFGFVNSDFTINLSGTQIVITTSLLDGKLHNIKSVRVGSAIEIFLDGVSIQTGTTSNSITLNRIGVLSTGSFWFDGVISEVKIYDNSVTTDLIRYYKLQENLALGTTIVDSGSDGSNGTAVSITSSELFTLVGNDWLGSELVYDNTFSNASNWLNDATFSFDTFTVADNKINAINTTSHISVLSNSVANTFSITSGWAYQLQTKVLRNSGTDNVSVMVALAPTSSTIFQLSSVNYDGTLSSEVLIANNTDASSYFKNQTSNVGTVDYDISFASVKRILQAP